MREQTGTEETEATLGTIEAADSAAVEREPRHRELGQVDEVLDNRYRIERLLGRGAMGEVYLAHDQRLGRQVALKLVRASSMSKARRLQVRLEREALALARVAHPNVVGIYDVGNHAGQTYLTMQFVAGTTLREWQRADRNRSELIDAYVQAGQGLAAAHTVGVVHRDFKPDNVIVGDDGVVRVLDFGLAAAMSTAPGESSSHGSSSGSGSRAAVSSSLPSEASGSGSAATLDAEFGVERSGMSPSERMTQTGALLGTMAYMSSEQLEGRDADARSDQFGFCVAMWEALTGKRPFAGGGLFELVLNIESGPVGGDGLPHWLRPILARGLRYDPQRRWPSMVDLLRAIERGRTRGRKLLLVLGLPVVVGGAVLLGRNLGPAAPPPEDECAAFVEQIDARWSATERAAIESHAELDAEATAYAIAGLDELAGDWQLAAAAACEAEATPPAPAERECLLRWLDGFTAAIELLAERGDQNTLAHAPDLLAQLRPPDADYCALGPRRPVDPEVWRLTERARALTVLGDLEGARGLAEAALARARELDQREYSGERALAHAAQAEIAVTEGDTPAAIAELGLAQRNALAVDLPDVLLETWTTWAKLPVLGHRSGIAAGEVALARIEQAEPLLFSLNIDESDPRRGELLEARGLSERARGNYHEAIAHHREAQSLFVAAGQPTLAAKSLANLGANYQDLGDREHARRSYTEALALLDAAGLPASYRSRIPIERNLGLLAYASTQRDEIANGLKHFELVLEHGNESERFEMHELILALVLELDDAELTRTWADRALAALTARPQASAAEAFRIQRVAGIALAYLDDPRGEQLLAAAERSASSLPLLMQFNLQTSWVEWLEHVGRCGDAHDRRERLATLVAGADAEVADLHTDWRSRGPTAGCGDETSPTHN
jgi:tRNA A-37 threonylcarbamoyl transferase component Bud32/tetratricopeptide (TPR) repeat protein